MSTISNIIIENWDDLSERAQTHIRATRPHLLRRWDISEHGCTFASVEADTLEEALAAARELVESGDSGYDLSEGPVYADYYVTNAVTGERDGFSVTWDMAEPPCEDGEEHDWQSPHSLLGGVEENPGVFAHGGGVIIRSCCARCGRYQVVDTWAERPDTGERVRCVRYEDADEASLAWVEELRDD